jgi:Ser/Thr protein kinase RdoA (MazF antagonist)
MRMFHDDAVARAVLQRFCCQPMSGCSLNRVAQAGFSGAMVWRVESNQQTWALRAWPPDGPSPARLNLIHRVAEQVIRNGFDLVPRVFPAKDGGTFVEHAGRFWELASWRPGRALPPEEHTEATRAAALEALARFHRAAELHLLPALAGKTHNVSPNLVIRQSELLRLRYGGLLAIERAVRESPANALSELAEEILHWTRRVLPAIEQRCRENSDIAVPLQTCLRDVWWAHVLFKENKVSGVIDLGSLGHDSVATDLARLLGSLAGADYRWSASALAAYERVRPLSVDERRLIEPLHQTSVLLSPLNWLKWAFIERRTWEDSAAVRERVGACLAQLRSLAVALA